MLIVRSLIVDKKEPQSKIYLLKIHSPEIASVIQPGQFLNIHVSDDLHPLLRRPFSVCDVEGENIYIMFNILGEGTRILSRKNKGDTLDILGPLGIGFNLIDDYETAIIVAGGLGAAPFPYLTRRIKNEKKILTFIGGKTNLDVITFGMINYLTSSDDGTSGFEGTVVELLNSHLNELKSAKIKVFGCGPNAMLKALKNFCVENDFNCEVSTECAMACGFGICQGCPIESTENPDKYLLVCKDGPVFNIRDIAL